MRYTDMDTDKETMSKIPTQTLREDPGGPDLGNFLASTLDSFAINRAQLEEDAANQMEKAKGAATEYVNSIEALKLAENNQTNIFGELAENERGTGEKLTETAIKQRVSRDIRMQAADTAVLNAEVRHESAKLAMKMFWERGEMIRALLFSRNQEMRAFGAPPSGEYQSAAAPGTMTKAIQAKHKKGA